MKWWLTWLWLKFCLAVHQDGENSVNWAIPRIKAALRRLDRDDNTTDPK